MLDGIQQRKKQRIDYLVWENNGKEITGNTRPFH